MRILKLIATALTGILALISIAVGAARATLPRTDCEVTPAQLEKLELGQMKYSNVKSALGCEGVVRSRQDIGGTGQFVLETYSWRIAAWPYGRFDGEFINGSLEGKTEVWFNLKLAPSEG